MGNWLTSGKEALDTGRDVIAILDALRGRRDNFRELAIALTGGDVSAELKARLDEDQLRLLRTFYRKIGEEAALDAHFKALLSPVSELTDASPLTWTFLSNPRKSWPRKGDLTFSLGGSARAATRVEPGPRYVFEGRLGMASSMKAPFRFGALKASSKIDGQAKLEIEFRHAGNPLLITAMAKDLAIIDDLTSLTTVSGKPFRSLSLVTSGEVHLSASLRAGRRLTVRRGGSGLSASAKAGVAYKVRWAKSGSYRLIVTRETVGLRVRLEEDNKVTSSRTLSIGAEMNLSGVEKLVAPLMKEISAFPVPLEKAVRQYGKPGKWIKRKLAGLVSGQDEIIQQLVAVLSSRITAKQLIGELTGKIETVIDERQEQLTEVLNGKVDDISARVAATLPKEIELYRKDLATYLQRKLTTALEEYNDELEAALKTLLADSGEAVTESLAAFAGRSDEFLGNVDEKAKQWLLPFKRALKRYRAIEEELQDAIEAIEQEKIAVRFARTVSAGDTSEALVDLVLTSVNDRTEKLYRQMLTGDFAAALDAAMDPEASDVTLENCVWSRVFANKITTGLTVNLFGREFGGTRTLTSKIRVRTENGEISVLQGRGSVQSSNHWFGEKLSVRLGSLNHLLVDDDQQKNVLQVRATYFDPELKRQEMVRHLREYENRQLIPAGSTERIVETRRREKIVNDVTITTVLSLDREDVRTLARLPPDTILQQATLAQVDSLRRYEWSAKRLREIEDHFDEDAGNVIHSLRDKPDRTIQRSLGWSGRGMTPKEILGQAFLINRVNDNGRDLIAYLSLWEELVAADTPLVTDVKVDEEQLLALRDLNRDMTEKLDGWVKAGGVIHKFAGSDISPWSLAFFMVLTRLLGRNEFLVPIVSWKVAGRVRRVVVV